MDAAEQRARAVLSTAGLDPSVELIRAVASSEVWLAPDVVVRVHKDRDDDGLAREAALSPLLPDDVPHAPMISYGNDGTVEWLVAKRLPGIPLAQAWPEMEIAQRRHAIMQLTAALRALHRTSADGLPKDEDMRPPHVLPLDRALDQAEQVRAVLGHGLLDQAIAFMTERWDAFDDEDRGLVHGDPHLENVLWDGSDVSALLDLEWARVSWIHVDLEILLHVASEPAAFVWEETAARTRAYDYRMVPAWLADGYPEWFAHPRLLDRLLVLCLDRTIGWVADERSGPGDLPEASAMLRDLLDGKSHLHRLLA